MATSPWVWNPFLTPGFLTNDPFGAPKSLDQIPPAPDKLSEEEIFIEFGDALVHRFLGIPLTAEEKEALLFLGILVDPIEIDPPAAGRGADRPEPAADPDFFAPPAPWEGRDPARDLKLDVFENL